MTYRNQKLRELCHAEPCQIQLPGFCTGGTNPDAPSVPAHANWLIYGRGKDHKAADVYVVPACPGCHAELDHGHTLSREERHNAWLRGWIRWQLIIWESGKVKVT